MLSFTRIIHISKSLFKSQHRTSADFAQPLVLQAMFPFYTGHWTKHFLLSFQIPTFRFLVNSFLSLLFYSNALSSHLAVVQCYEKFHRGSLLYILTRPFFVICVLSILFICQIIVIICLNFAYKFSASNISLRILFLILFLLVLLSVLQRNVIFISLILLLLSVSSVGSFNIGLCVVFSLKYIMDCCFALFNIPFLIVFISVVTACV